MARRLSTLSSSGGLTPWGTPVEATLAPGKEIELYELKLELKENTYKKTDGVVGAVSMDSLWASGKVSIQYERLASPDIDAILSKLATGKLELEVKAEPPPAATEKKAAPKQEPEQEEEPFTAWGKEAGGLQAGIRLKAIDVLNAANQWETTQPVGKIHQGNVLRFEVIVRNVSKQDVRLKYIQPSGWICSEDGRDLEFSPGYSGGTPIRYEKTLRLGENWQVAQLNVTTRQPKPTESFSGLQLLELGKFRVSCPCVLMQEEKDKLATGEVEIEIVPPKGEKAGKVERGQEDKNENVIGPSINDPSKGQPAATGKLELEVKAEPPPAATEKK